MNNVFNYITFSFLKDKTSSIYKRIYYDKMFFLSYGIHNVPWGERTFCDLIYKLKYFLNIPSECVILAIVYMKRLVVHDLYITEFNIRNIFITCILVSHKFLVDSKLHIISYSSLTTIPVKYLIKMELYIIKLLNYRLFVDEILYFQIFQLIQSFA